MRYPRPSSIRARSSLRYFSIFLLFIVQQSVHDADDFYFSATILLWQHQQQLLRGADYNRPRREQIQRAFLLLNMTKYDNWKKWHLWEVFCMFGRMMNYSRLNRSDHKGKITHVVLTNKWSLLPVSQDDRDKNRADFCDEWALYF